MRYMYIFTMDNDSDTQRGEQRPSRGETNADILLIVVSVIDWIQIKNHFIAVC